MARIERTPSGKYRIRVYIGKDAAGKKHWKSITHNDKKKLKLIAAEYENTHKEYIEYDTFKKAAENYIAIRKPVLSPYTIKTYQDTLDMLSDKYSWFCDSSVGDISEMLLQKLINALAVDGKSSKYIRNIHGFIRSTISNAGCDVPSITLPEKKRPDLHEPTTDEIKKVIEASAGTALEVPILLGIHGLRRGEICALHYPEDFEDNVAHIKRSAVYLGKGERFEKTPKNQQSDRLVPLTPSLVKKIEKQGYVVRCAPQTLTTSFRKLLEKNKLPLFRFHDLRHYFASYLHEQGFTDEEIISLGGWKTDYVMKRVYRYALDDGTNGRMKEAMAKLF